LLQIAQFVEQEPKTPFCQNSTFVVVHVSDETANYVFAQVTRDFDVDEPKRGACIELGKD